MLSHRPSLNKSHTIDRTQIIFPISKKVVRIFPTIWKAHHILLSNAWVKEEITTEIRLGMTQQTCEILNWCLERYIKHNIHTPKSVYERLKMPNKFEVYCDP